MSVRTENNLVKDTAALKEAGRAIRAEIKRQDRAAKAGKSIDRGWHRPENEGGAA